MPLLMTAGPVQRHPVVRLILWGAHPDEASAARQEERRADALAQPLLKRFYGVDPARSGGTWQAPGSPLRWLEDHHEAALSNADLASLITRARRAMKWPATKATQWWLATDLTGRQLGMKHPACADHFRTAGVRGVVVRLAFGSCTTPGPRTHPQQGARCAPVASIRPTVGEPTTVRAGVDLLIDHEFAEAATDPSNGWRVLVAPRCGNDVMLEIADVCAADGPLISAPAYDTGAGWQPSILEPPREGRAVRCVDPARPGS